MIEAMACGTPVIGFRCGSVPEVVENDISGFVVETVDQATAVVARVARLDRAKVRAAFEHRFTMKHRARDYLEIYNKLIGSAALSTRYQGANSDRKREASYPAGTRVPDLPPTVIVTKRVRPRGEPSARVLTRQRRRSLNHTILHVALFRIPPLKLPENSVIKRHECGALALPLRSSSAGRRLTAGAAGFLILRQ